MSKKVILVLARYAFPYHVWIDDGNDKVLFTLKSNMKYFDSSARRSFKHIETFEKYEEGGLVELRALQLHKEFGFTHVVMQAEQDLIRASRIRAHLGIAGQSVASAVAFRDKCTMKDQLKAAGVPVPTYVRLQSPTDLLLFIREHGYPLVVKPVCGMGAMNTAILRGEEDLEVLMRKGLTSASDGLVDLEAERFVDGLMHHIDGFVHEGTMRIAWPSVYKGSCAGFEDNSFLASYSLSKGNPLVARLQAFTKQVLEALDAPPSYSFHVEVWHTPEDAFVVCEAACRTGGAGVNPSMLELFLVNLDKAYVQAQCGDVVTSPLPASLEACPVPDVCTAWILTYPKVGKLEEVPSSCPLEYVLSYEATARAGKVFRGMEHCTDCLASFLLRGASEEEISARVDEVVAWFEASTQWGALPGSG